MRLNRRWIPYDIHAAILGLGLLLAHFGPAGDPEIMQVGVWAFVYVGVMLQATYLGSLFDFAENIIPSFGK